MTSSKPLWQLLEVAQAVQGVANQGITNSDVALYGVDIDSRNVTAGSLFVALKGSQSDGHKYIDQAFAQGAGAVLIQDKTALRDPNQPHVLVEDTQAALEQLARHRRSALVGQVSAITGSAGKTGSKEALRLCLERAYPRQVHASIASYNNHTGVPLSLARCPADVQHCVLEMGMNHAGELTALSGLGKPHVALITTIASAHRAFFDSEEAIADAKAEIFLGLLPGGVAIINQDNRHYARLRAHAERAQAGKIISFGWQSTNADVRALKVARFATGSTITADVMGDLLTFKIAQPGEHWVLNALGVLAVVKALGADLGLAGLALADMVGLAGRGRRLRVATRDGGHATLLDEAYNANPASMAAALDVLSSLVVEGEGRRIAILGDMKELGAQSADLHKDLAGPLRKAGVRVVWTVGDEIAVLKQALDKMSATMDIAHMHFDSADDILASVRTMIRNGDCVLIKGSNSMGLGKVVTALAQEG
jgi:UDP-N-acetylmuramoyl-tripeptide--D-alanyl-D-alanine ligase